MWWLRHGTLRCTRNVGFRKHEARRGKSRRRRLLFTALALAPGLARAEEAGSVICPLAPSRRLLWFAEANAPSATHDLATRRVPECGGGGPSVSARGRQFKNNSNITL